MRFSQKRDIVIFLISLVVLARFGLRDDIYFYATYDYQSAVADQDYLALQPQPGAFYNDDEGRWFGPYLKQSNNKHELCQWWAELEHKHSLWAHGYSLPTGDPIRVVKMSKQATSVECHFAVKTVAHGWQNTANPGVLKVLTYSALLPRDLLPRDLLPRDLSPQDLSPQDLTPHNIAQTPNDVLPEMGATAQQDNLVFEGRIIDNIFLLSSDSSRWSQQPEILLWGNKIVYADKSTSHLSKSAACLQGLAEFKTRAPATSLLHTLTAEFQQDTCFLRRGKHFVSALGIINNTPYGNSPPEGLIQLQYTDGSLAYYYRNPSTDVYTIAGLDGDSRLRIHGGLAQLTSPSAQKLFNQNGQLIESSSAAGELIYRYLYSHKGELITIQDKQGHQFNYDFRNGLLARIQAPNGKFLQFNYNGNLLTHVTFPDQTIRHYHYEDTRFPRLLTGITDQSGVRIATWRYDSQGRRIFVER